MQEEMKAVSTECKIYYISLNKNGSAEYEKSEVLQILSGDHIIFNLHDTSVLGTDICLRVNLPFEKDGKLVYPPNIPPEKYDPAAYDDFAKVEATPGPKGGVFFDVLFSYSGSFFFQIEYQDLASETTKLSKADWILVQPRDALPAESMTLLSVLTRCLGKLKRWPEVLASQAKLGYNAIHFMPVQAYGESGSMYSLRDHQTVDDWYFDDVTLPPEERLEILKTIIETLNKTYKLKCLLDIIPNHVSPACAWLKEHPEAAYNLHNSPHLRVAWEYDKFLKKFSDDFVDGKIPDCPSAPFIGNEKDLQTVLKALEKEIKKLPLGDYFKYNRKTIKEKFIESEVTEKVSEDRVIDYLKTHSTGYGIAPFGVDVSALAVVTRIIVGHGKA